MLFKSIRLRLALSFAAIALLATLVLGAVLLAILQNYYANLELNYLRGNAKAISAFVTSEMLSNSALHDELQSQIENLAFLSQARIQVYQPNGQLLCDSGSPQNVSVNLGAMKQILAQTKGSLPNPSLRIITVLRQNGTPLPTPDVLPTVTGSTTNGDTNTFFYRSIQVDSSPFGFYLNGENVLETARSKLVVTENIVDSENSKQLGSVRLSEGPAYGSAILVSVAQGWAFASAIAVLLAAAVGWYISQRISAPVLALTHVTARMAQGDLSSRASVENRDEFGQLARSFNEMADQVETTITTLRTFVSDAAHEINTPLTALKTNLELAVNEPNFRQRKEFLESAIEQNERIENLANELLDLARIETTQSNQDFELFDLQILCAQIAEQFGSRAEQAGRVFNVSLPEHEILMRGIKQQIQRGVENLLENALKFTEPDGLITLEVLSNDQEVILMISDSGIGILPADLPQLFQRFHRGQNSAEYSGNGLGLAIVKAIVNAHRGSVDAQSAGSGEGSRFSIRLPRKAF
jgi:signal transduction histidine kinase